MKLVIENTLNDSEVRAKLVGQVMDLADKVYGFAVQLIKGFTDLPKGTEIAWRVKVDQFKGPEDDWYGRATCKASLITPLKLLDGHCVMVPVTEISNVVITQNFTRNGFRFGWHDHNHFEVNRDMVKDMAIALAKGQLPSGFHYRCNQFPNLSKLTPYDDGKPIRLEEPE